MNDEQGHDPDAITDKGITESEIVDFKYGSQSNYSQPTQVTKNKGVELFNSDNRSAIRKVERDIAQLNDLSKAGSSKSLAI